MLGLLEAIPTVRPYPSKSNFILCQLPEGTGPRVFEGSLQPRHLSPPLEQSQADRLRIRTSVGFPEENDAVAAALAELTQSPLALEGEEG